MATSNEFVFDKDSIAILRLPLAETVPAVALREIIAIIDDSYFGHLWLSRAEASDRKYPFPDEYTPTEDETLYVFQAETGTPNFIDFMGLLQFLLPALGVAGTALGLATASVTVIKTSYEIKKLRIEIEIKKQELRKALADAERDPANTIQGTIDVRNTGFGLANRAKRLRASGKISDNALKHKTEMEEEIIMQSVIYLQNYAGHPTLIIIQQQRG